MLQKPKPPSKSMFWIKTKTWPSIFFYSLQGHFFTVFNILVLGENFNFLQQQKKRVNKKHFCGSKNQKHSYKASLDQSKTSHPRFLESSCVMFFDFKDFFFFFLLLLVLADFVFFFYRLIIFTLNFFYNFYQH